MTEKQRIAYDPIALLRKMERCTTIPELQLAAEEAKTAPDADKSLLRQLYAVKLKEIQGAGKVPEGYKSTAGEAIGK